mmetsp:Transcript_3678/g.7649  ORF Transcript_3678/g.7649 Transcript_3678/m.7649 type:complete len:111 (-) Transcript_3678:1869-2201(-)
MKHRVRTSQSSKTTTREFVVPVHPKEILDCNDDIAIAKACTAVNGYWKSIVNECLPSILPNCNIMWSCSLRSQSWKFFTEATLTRPPKFNTKDPSSTFHHGGRFCKAKSP